MPKRVRTVLLLIILLGTVLTGCIDAREPDDEVYALAIGVDSGVNNKIRFTIQYPTYMDGETGGGGKSQMGGSNEVSGTNIHTVETSTILEALDMFGMAISRRVSLMHTKILIFSEEFARQGVGRYLAPMARYRETRRVMNIVVVNGSAEDFIKENLSNIGGSISKAIELMMVQSDNTGFFPKIAFHEFYRGMLSGYEQSYAAYGGLNNFKKLASQNAEVKNPPLVVDKGYLPGELPRKGIAKREFAGTAVFDGDRMVGALNSDETRYLLMITGKFKRGIFDLRDEKSPDDAIPLDIRPGRRPVIKARFQNGVPVIDVTLRMEADVGAIQSRINYENKNALDKLNKQCAHHLKSNALKVIHKVQKEYKSDIFGFGQEVAGYFPTIQEWEEYNWLKHFQEAEVNVDVQLNIRRTGLMINSSPIKDPVEPKKGE